MIDRNKFLKEVKEQEQLRHHVRKKVYEFFSHKNKEKKQEILEEMRLRKSIRLIVKQVLEEGKMLQSPHPSTGVNMLIDLLKKIVPVIKADYRLLTTNKSQRESYRAHLVANISKVLERQDLQDQASRQAVSGQKEVSPSSPEQGLEEDAGPTLKINSEPEKEVDTSKFLDIEEPKKTDKVPGEGKKSEEEEKKDFTLAGHDLTGRNRAFTTFQKIETDISTVYGELSAKVDKDVFKDYLITNIKLHLDQAENEMQPMVQEPTTTQYEKEKGSI